MRRLLLALGILTFLPLLGFSADAVAADKKNDKQDEKKAKNEKPRLAVFRLNSPVTELPADETFSFSPSSGITLKDLVRRMKKAADDPDIKAVVILPEGGTIGLAQTEEVRQAMQLFRKTGKDIYVHADSLSMREYTLLCGASRLSVVPTADLWLIGLAGEGALSSRPARQTRRQAGLPHLRRLQERRRDVHAQRAEPRGREDAELAARRHLHHLGPADRSRPRPQARKGPRADRQRPVSGGEREKGRPDRRGRASGRTSRRC